MTDFEQHLRQAIGTLPDHGAVQTVLALGVTSYAELVALLTDPTHDAGLISSVCWLLGNWLEPSAIPPLVACLDHAEWGVRIQALSALGYADATHPAIPRIIRLLHEDDNPHVRNVAALTLGTIGGEAALTALLACIDDPRQLDAVRGCAMEALNCFPNHPVALATVLAGLNHPLGELRFWAAYALGEIGSLEHIPALEALLDDPAEIPNWWTVGQEVAETIAHLRERATWGEDD